MDAAGAAAADAAAIAAGTPSRALMQRAGAAAAAEITRTFSHALARGVVIATGAGNNGGDGWVVARALHAVGIAVRVVECAPARTPDAIAERAGASDEGVRIIEGASELASAAEPVVIDALLGTGFAGDSLRGDIAVGVDAMRALAERGAAIVALDVPSGLDASTGRSAGDLRCALTLTFATIKRGHLVAREACGEIRVLDIGLGVHASALGARDTSAGGSAFATAPSPAVAPPLATAAWFHASLPAIAADAHKGTRRKVAVVGGAAGMAGAAMLAARAALRSGAGMVKCVVSPASLGAIQEGEPAALASRWPESDEEVRTIADWPDAMLIGPGLGHDARPMIERLLRAFTGPVVLDADALNAFAGDPAALRALLGDREALLTPHPAEFARLASTSVQHTLDARFTAPADLARATGATVLLKGVPTVISAPDGESIVVAEGTPTLATGGAGDVLGGIAVTLLAQTNDALVAGALAAFAHGRAAHAVSARQVRGHTLDDVLLALPAVWALEPATPRSPLLAELPAVGERAL